MHVKYPKTDGKGIAVVLLAVRFVMIKRRVGF